MVLCTGCFVCGDSFIKVIGNTLPVGEIMAILGLLSCIFLLIICAQQGILQNTPMIFSRAVLLRSILDLLAGFMFISALMNMPIAIIASIMQSVPLVVVVFAILFLGEKGGVRRAAAVVIGFLGVMLVVKPAPQTVSIYQFLALATVVMVALRDIVTKKIPPQVPLLIVALANAVFAGAGGLAFGLLQGFRALETWHLFLLLGAGIFITWATSSLSPRFAWESFQPPRHFAMRKCCLPSSQAFLCSTNIPTFWLTSAWHSSSRQGFMRPIRKPPAAMMPRWS